MPPLEHGKQTAQSTLMRMNPQKASLVLWKSKKEHMRQTHHIRVLDQNTLRAASTFFESNNKHDRWAHPATKENTNSTTSLSNKITCNL